MTGSMIHQLEIRLRGGLFIGGHDTDGRTRVSLLGVDGRPLVPASAVKGAIRCQVERLFGAEACDFFGASGVDPRQEAASGASEVLGGGTARVFFSDATVLGDRDLPIQVKPQVSIDRDTGTAVPERLFHREAVAPFSDGVLIAEVDTSRLQADELKRLRIAVSAVTALGAGRSSGLGWVEMTLQEAPVEKGREDGARLPEAPVKKSREDGVQLPEAPEIDLLLEAEDPLCIGKAHQLGNFFPTRQHLPAPALRGALATAALRFRGDADVDQSNDPEFRRLLLDDETCMRFAVGWPVGQQEFGPAPRPAPLSLWRCKARPEEHGRVDQLLADFYCHLLGERGVHVPGTSCQDCGSRLERVSEGLGTQAPSRRFATRLRMDPATGRGMDGHLFAVELLERGNHFRARVAGLDAAGRQLLEDAFRGTVRIGHGRGMGYGRVRLVEAQAVANEDLLERVAGFDQQVRRDLKATAEAFKKPPDWLPSHRHYLSVTLTSDLVITAGHRPLARALLEALDLGEDVELGFAALWQSEQGGWDARRHRPKDLDPALAGGGVALLARDEPWDGLLDRLERIEQRGAGGRRSEGFGWVRFADPLHLVDPLHLGEELSENGFGRG